MTNTDEKIDNLIALASELLLQLKQLTANYFVDYRGEVLCREIAVSNETVYLDAEERPIKYIILHNPSYQETTDGTSGDKTMKADAGNLTAMQGNQVFWGFHGNNNNELFTGATTDKIYITKPEHLSLNVNAGKGTVIKYELYY